MMLIAVASANMMSAIFMALILWAIVFLKATRNLSNRLFYMCVALAMCFCFIDSMSHILEPYPEFTEIVYYFMILSFMGGNIITAVFAYYVWSIIKERQTISIWYPNTMGILSSLGIILVIYGCLSKQLFYLEDGSLIAGPMYSINGYYQLLVLLIFFALVLYKRKILGFRSTVAISTYAVIPSITLIIRMFVPNFAFKYSAVAVSFMIVYILLQAGEIQKVFLKQKVMEEMLYTDGLTGLKNRRAYDDFLDNIDTDVPVFVLFSDLNGLKFANDNKGHEAGDELLIRYGRCLSRIFGKDSVYRISGDEFVVLKAEATEHTINREMADFHRMIEENKDIAAIGTAFGNGHNIADVIKMAEMCMYKDKKEYYDRTGQDRRI